MIEQELGLSLVELFSEISSEPVAAAFLGQVHLLCHFGNFFLLTIAEILRELVCISQF